MSERRRGDSKGLPGGIVPPAVLLVVSSAVFVLASRHPGSFDLGPHFSAAGLGVLGAAAGLFWLLAAIAKRRSGRR